LISLSESLLVEYLDCDSGRWSNSDIKVLIPSWAQTLFRRAGGVCLIGVNGDDSEWVWETENLSLHKGVGGKDSNSDGLCLLLVRHLKQPPGVLLSRCDWKCWKCQDGERTEKESLS
jgi:hypothetical protein